MKYSKKAIEEIKEHPMVEKVEIVSSKKEFLKDVIFAYDARDDIGEGEYISVYTKELTLHNKRDPTYRRLIGRVKLGIGDPLDYGYGGRNYLSPIVTFERPDAPGKYILYREGDFHVHVFSNGRFCGGDQRALAVEAEKGNLLATIDYCLNFLQMRGDGYGAPYPEMAKKPLVKLKNGKWIKASTKDLPRYMEL